MQPQDEAQAGVDQRKALLMEGFNRGILPDDQKLAVQALIDRGVWVNTDTRASKSHQPVEKPGFWKQFSPELVENLDNRQKEVDRTFYDYVAGDIGLVEATTQTIGKGIAGTLLDLGGETASIVIDGWSAMIPDSVEDPVIETTKEGFNWLKNTDSGEFIGETLDAGIDEWQGFKDKNPQTAKTIESVVDVAVIFAPTKVKAKKGPLPILKSAADKIDDIAVKQATDKQRTFVERLVTPKKTNVIKTKEAYRTDQAGLFNKNKTRLTPREIEIADQVQKLGVGQMKSKQANFNIIQEANTKYAKELNALIAKNNTNLHPQVVFDAVDDAAKVLIASNPVIVGDSVAVATKISTKAKEIIATHPPTAHGLFKARKEFDAWVRSQKGDAIFDPKMDSALSLSVREVRGAMNKTLDNTIHKAKIHTKLKEQARLYDAMENLAPKVADESSNAIGRLWQNIGQTLPIKAQFNRDLAILFGMTTFGVASYVAPWMVGGLAIGGTGVAAYKGLMSASMKKGLAKLIAKTDDAIRVSRNSDMIRQLRLDRAYAVDLLKQSETADTETPYRTEFSPKNIEEQQ